MADEFDTGAGAADCVPEQASALRRGGYVMLKDHPCKIVDLSTSKTGKHGHAKINMCGIDIFTGKKYEQICQSTHNMQVPTVTRNEYTLVDIDDEGYCMLMDDRGEMKEDLQLPEGEVGDGIKAGFQEGSELIITVIAAVGQEAILSHRTSNN